MFEAAIFDLDGLLVDSDDVHLAAWNEYLKQYDVHLDEYDAVGLADRRDFDNAELFYRRFSLPVDPLTMVEERNEIFMELAENQIEPLPGAVDILRYLKENGWRNAIISGGMRDYIYLMMDKMELVDEVDVVVAGDMIDLSKPNPMPFVACTETFALHPSACLVFEDTRMGVEAARNANMKVVCVPGRKTERWRIAGADLVLNSLNDITLPGLRSLWIEEDFYRLRPQLQPEVAPRRSRWR
jgi:beta-phosphoglucomutase